MAPENDEGAHEGPADEQARRKRGHFSIAVLPHQWFIACASGELGRRPIGVTLQDVPLVLFRDASGRPAALLDRCPHRNVPLSVGRVTDGTLQCAYHGWRFDRAGTCREIPGFCGEPASKARRAPSYAAEESDGFVWVYSTPDVEPRTRPFRFPLLNERGYTTVRREFTVHATMHAAVENALDVPHTAFLHGGLFRTAKKENEIEVVVRRYGDRVEAEYVGEPRPKGLVGRLLAPGGGTVTHFDRFLLPNLTQVEYKLGDSSHLVATSAMVPVRPFETKVVALVTFRLPIPSALVKPFLTPVAVRIFHQDAVMLDLQTRTIERFGGEQYVSTEIDVIGPHVLRLLRHAEKGEPLSSELVHENRIRMRT